MYDPGLVLTWLLQLQALVLHWLGGLVGLSIADRLGTLVSYLGAGVYEELLFRLILLSGAIGVLGWLRFSRRASTVGGIVITSLLFSAAHYIGASGDLFNTFTFLFRFLAGIFFSLLFCIAASASRRAPTPGTTC